MTARKTIPLTITHTEDLHMRPMQELAKAASRFASSIRIEKNGQLFDAKSVLDLLNFISLSIEPNQQCAFDFKLHTEGPDADAAANEVVSLVQNDFWLMYSRRLSLEKRFIDADAVFRFAEAASEFSVPIRVEANGSSCSALSPLELVEMAGKMTADGGPDDIVEFILRCGPDAGEGRAQLNAPDPVALKAANALEQLVKDKLGRDVTRFVDFRHDELTSDFLGAVASVARDHSSAVSLKCRSIAYDLKANDIVKQLAAQSESNNRLGASGHLRCEGADALAAWNAIKDTIAALRKK